MSEPSENDCAECEEPDFECERCGCGFCLDHVNQHTPGECDRFRKELQVHGHVESGAAPTSGEDQT